MERDCCQFVASSSDSEVANGSTDELNIGVAGAEPVKKVRVWSSFSEGQSDKSDLENTASVSESSSEENTTILVSSYEEDSEYISRSIITLIKHGVHNCYINFNCTMNFILYFVIAIYLYYIKLSIFHLSLDKFSAVLVN